MTQEVSTLINLVESKKDSLNQELRLAYKKFRMWQELLEKVVAIDPANPNIVALALTQKIVAYSGIIESLHLGKGSSESFEKFFGQMIEEEKFLVLMAIRLGQGTQAKDDRRAKIAEAYLKNSQNDFDRFFQETINNNSRDLPGLYNLRSRLVHSGEYAVAMVASSGPSWTYSPDMKLQIDETIICLDEMFIIGFCRKAGIAAQDTKDRVKQFLLHHGFATKNQENNKLFKTRFK